MTLFLAIWGATLGTLTAAAQLFAFWRDRPDLQITVTTQASVGKPGAIVVTVANQGRQPTTLVKCALLMAAGEFTVSIPDGPQDVPFPRPELNLLGDSVALIRPGQVQRLGFALTQWPSPLLHADTPLRAYVVDSHGRWTWGPAMPLLRMLLNAGIPAPPGTDPRALIPPPDMKPIVPAPVFKSWQLWKPRSLRKPQPLPPVGPWTPRPTKSPPPTDNGPTGTG